jgi:hypothetical protein
MGHLQLERRVLSRPAEVWWSGFRSTTPQLQQHGWEIAAEESVYDGRIRLMLRHQEMRLYAITRTTEWDYMAMDRIGAPLVFQVVGAAPRMECHVTAEIGAGWADFRQVDALPQFVERNIQTAEDLRIFATPLVRTEELIVEPQTVAQLLEQVRKMQVPEQERIRAKQRLAENRQGQPIEIHPRQQFHAQILSISDYRQAA